MAGEKDRSCRDGGGDATAADGRHSGEVVKFLARRDTYDDATSDVEQIATHISWVFLTDRHAYKLKKPVRFDFLDFSTADKRRAACEEEVRLNRRLAADVYLGVIPVTIDREDRLQLGGDGRPIDWVVHMRRLPAERTLERLIREGRIERGAIDRVAALLVDFYRGLEPLPISAAEYRLRIERHVRANRRELLDAAHALDAATVRRVHMPQLEMLETSPEAFDRRVSAGRIVDGHGDLRPEHIYLESSPVIIDCIEFSPEFRQLDVADELAFLAVECDRLGAADVGRRVIEAYQQATGDRPPQRLLHFYRGYRGCVRAKVMALRAEQLEGAERTAALDAARSYLNLADDDARTMGPPLLLVVRGLMGTGKSTLAAAIGDALGIEVVASDAVRRELFGAATGAAGYNEQRYDPANRRRVYETMFGIADEELAAGSSIILDATFLSTASRDEAGQLSRRHGARLLVIECRCPAEVATERIARRQSQGWALSEARPELYSRQQADEGPDPVGLPVIVVDTTSPAGSQQQVVYERLTALRAAAD